MPTGPKPNEFDLARIPRWAKGRVPVAHQDEARVELGVRGQNVTVWELRAPWCDEVGPDWSRRPVAQLRHTGAGFWLLMWKNRRIRWERYPLTPAPTRDLDALLAELDEDGTSMFWG